MHATESELPINEAIAKELTLSCSYAYTGEDFAAALRLLRSGAVPYRRWITEFPLAAGQAAFEALVDHPDQVTKAVLWCDGREPARA